LLANLASEFQKKCRYVKTFHCPNLNISIQKNAEFYADFKIVEKNGKKMLNKKLQTKKWQNLEFALFSITNLFKFSFLGVIEYK
jgi:hypothetical protein